MAGRDGENQLDTIGTCRAFDHLHILLFRKNTDDLPGPLANVFIQKNFLPILRDNDDVVGPISRYVGRMVHNGRRHGERKGDASPRGLSHP